MRVQSRETESKICDLIDRVTTLEERVTRLEKPRAGVEDDQVSFEEPAPSEGVGAEYWLGARLLPRLGAVIIILAIAFIAISESSKNASVDRWVLLLLEAVLCVGFIAIGEWKRDELEGFGRTLSAIGACGLYVTAATGHFAYHTFTAAGMAAAFATLSIANHTYAVLRNTRLFFVIGATGGLAAMVFPLLDYDYATGVAVYTTVTIAAAVVCAARKWMALAFFGWLLGIAILVPVFASDFSRLTLVLALETGSLACVWAFAASHKSKELDAGAVFAGILVIITGAIGLSLLGGLPGAAVLAGYSAVALCVSLSLAPDSPSKSWMAIGALATGALLIPMCLPGLERTYSYGLAVALVATLGQFRFASYAAAFAVALYVFALGSYVQWRLTSSGFGEAPLLLALGGALAFVGWALKRASWGYTSFSVAGIWILLSRSILVLFPPAPEGTRLVSPIILATIVFAVALLTFGFRLKSEKLRLWSMAVMLVGVVQTAIVSDGSSSGFRLLAALVFGSLMLFAGFRYLHSRDSAT